MAHMMGIQNQLITFRLSHGYVRDNGLTRERRQHKQKFAKSPENENVDAQACAVGSGGGIWAGCTWRTYAGHMRDICGAYAGVYWCMCSNNLKTTASALLFWHYRVVCVMGRSNRRRRRRRELKVWGMSVECSLRICHFP